LFQGRSGVGLWNLVLNRRFVRRRKPSTEQEALRQCFARWSEIVELFARRRVARKRVDAVTDVAQHRELIARCHALAASADEVESAFCRYLQDLAAPWLDPTVLDRADREILLDLRFRCRDALGELGGRSSWRSLATGRTAVGATALIFAVLLWWMGDPSVSHRLLKYARAGLEDMWLAIVYFSDLERLFVVGCGLLAASICAVARKPKC
jgi:hypothetical protein